MVVNTPYGVQGTGVCGVCSSVRRVMNTVQWDKQSHGHEGVRVARKGWAVGLRRTMNREQLHSKSHQSTITLRGQRGVLFSAACAKYTRFSTVLYVQPDRSSVSVNQVELRSFFVKTKR